LAAAEIRMVSCIIKTRNVATIVLLILSYNSKSTDAFAGIFGDGKGAGGGAAAGGGGGDSEGIDLGAVAPDPLTVATNFFGDIFAFFEGGGLSSAINSTNGTDTNLFDAVFDIALDTALETVSLAVDNLLNEVITGDVSEETEVTTAVGGGKQGGRRQRREKRGLRGVRV
jgi:hypothetical protein